MDFFVKDFRQDKFKKKSKTIEESQSSHQKQSKNQFSDPFASDGGNGAAMARDLGGSSTADARVLSGAHDD